VNIENTDYMEAYKENLLYDQERENVNEKRGDGMIKRLFLGSILQTDIDDKPATQNLRSVFVIIENIRNRLIQ